MVNFILDFDPIGVVGGKCILTALNRAPKDTAIRAGVSLVDRCAQEAADVTNTESAGYFKYSFFKSSGTFGSGGKSCEYPLSRFVVTSARSVPS